MKITRNILATALPALLAGALLLGTPVTRAATVTTRDNTTIAAQVQNQLATLPWYGVFDNLAFQVNGSEVILSGQVTSEQSITRKDAENAAKHVPGVTNVINRIEVLPTSPFDNQIRRAEYRTIFSQSDLGRYTMGAIPPVHIVVKNGHVSLEGMVMDQMDKNVAGLAANSVPGVFSVTNNLKIG